MTQAREASLITTLQDVRDAVETARAAGAVALDTEFLRERTYRARLCLVQIATDDGIWLIDATALSDLAPLTELLADPRVEVVVHAGKQDLQIFHDSYGVLPKNVFDVQIAAGFAGLGASLPYGRLIEEVLEVRLEKGESYSDWCTRPLTAAQLSYAADDVRYLLEAASVLKNRLAELDRMGWVSEEMRALQTDSSYANDPGDAWRRVGGRGSLSGRQVAVLKEVARWREEAAAARDLPRGWVVKDVSLVEIARRAPGSLGQLKAIRGINPREAERSGTAILDAVEKGKQADPIAAKKTPSRAVQHRVRALAGLADALIKARADQAGVATEFVATREELEAALVELLSGLSGGAEHALLSGWRHELAGRSILALVQGRIAIAATEDPPYVQEIELNR
ncbi:MAG: ribonuclease [Actinomycetota bacterium]|jgi:ribonuclease D|nr:ribonuclease [Actinomycetota bacterium]